MVPNFTSHQDLYHTDTSDVTPLSDVPWMDAEWLVTLFELVRWTRSKKMLIFNPADICLHANKCL